MKKFLSALFAFTTGMICLAGGITDLQRQFVKQRTKVIRRDTSSVPGYVVNTFQKGSKTWSETNRLSAITIQAPRKVSKLNLIITLKSINKWQACKQFIQSSGYEDEWLNCQYISTDFPLFIAATNAVVVKGLCTGPEIKSVIEHSYDNE